MEIDLVGGWGPRHEVLEDVVSRFVNTAKYAPEFPATGHWAIAYGSKRREFRSINVADNDDVAAAIIAKTKKVYAWPAPGYETEFFRIDDQGYPAVTVKIRAGFDGTIGISNHIVTSLQLADPESAQGARLVRDYMAVLVRSWQPSHLSAHSYKFMKAQGWQAQQISIGWDTYLSDDVTVDEYLIESEGLSIDRTDNGRYITLNGTVGNPNLQQAGVVRRALGYSVELDGR